MNTNTTNTTTTAEVKVRKSMTRDPKIAHKIASRKVMNRAWEIAENAFKSSRVNFEVILSVKTQAKSKTEFFKESLSIAWKEYREGSEIYVKATMPKKNLQTVLEAYEIASAKTNDSLAIAKAVVNARYGTNQTKLNLALDEISKFSQYELGLAVA